jgi:hypothetical protein
LQHHQHPLRQENQPSRAELFRVQPRNRLQFPKGSMLRQTARLLSILKPALPAVALDKPEHPLQKGDQASSLQNQISRPISATRWHNILPWRLGLTMEPKPVIMTNYFQGVHPHAMSPRTTAAPQCPVPVRRRATRIALNFGSLSPASNLCHCVRPEPILAIKRVAGRVDIK